jgi:hypothetical protein
MLGRLREHFGILILSFIWFLAFGIFPKPFYS